MKKLFGLFGLMLVALSLAAQDSSAPPQSTAPEVQPMDEMPVFRVKVVTRNTKATIAIVAARPKLISSARS